MSRPNAPLPQELEATKNPDDVAALYAWLGAKGLQYRDFSVSRSAYRARFRAEGSEAAQDAAADTSGANQQESAVKQQAAPSASVRGSKKKKHPPKAGLRLAGLAMAPVVLVLLGMAALPLDAMQQAVFAVLLFALAVVLNRLSRSHRMTLLLICMSSFVTLRYAIWRTTSLASFLHDPTSRWTVLDAFFMLSLFGAEIYAFLVMFLGYLQMLWPLRRVPAALPDDLAAWPDVDVLIPTYNEPLEVVRYTALAAANMDWPVEKMHVYILDDSKREEFRQFAQDAGVGYITRSDNRHAKAGNINHALQSIHSPFVAIFDCDHAPTRSFLQTTMGWFNRDPKMGLVQTPHHFYSPDPFERNLQKFRTMPNEGELFYGIIQDCNDFWNATFFCGSCAVLRREVLDQIGGIATETITEDAHTSLRMQMAGWNTSYIHAPQAAGLASERLSGHVKQRIRWARGMIQILRTDNPLFAKALSWQQRLCYFNAMLYFLYALPRLVFLTGPLIYLLLGHVNIPGAWSLILAYALPHLVLTSLTNSRIQGLHRHSFWNEVYETVLAPYILLPTLLALVNPKFGKFQVTDKGGVVEEAFFDMRIAQPFLVLFALNILGLVMGPIDYFYRDPGHLGTVVMNSLWTIFNTIILGVSMAVAYESQQRRQNVRIDMRVPVRLQTTQGEIGAGQTEDLSGGGSAIHLDATMDMLRGDKVSAILQTPSGEAILPARVMLARGRRIRIRFENLTIAEQEKLTMVLFSRADTWLEWGKNRVPDRPLHSLALITWISMQGIALTLRSLIRSKAEMPNGAPRHPIPATGVGIALIFLMGGMLAGVRPASAAMVASAASATPPAVAQTVAQAQTAASQVVANPESQFQDNFTLRDIGVHESIVLRGLDSTESVHFTLPQTDVASTATLHLRYRFSPALIPALSHVNVMLNGSLFAAVPMEAGAPDQPFEQVLTIPAEMLVHNNELSFEFIGHYAMGQEDPANTALWFRLDPRTSVEIAGDRLPLANNLNLLPVPFYDPDLVEAQSVPIVFLTAPSHAALQAAGVIASWLGVLADTHAIRFPVSIGSIPPGNVIVIAETEAGLNTLGLQAISGPTVALRANPSDPYGKLLILAGDNTDQVLVAAQAVALNPYVLHGDTAHVAAQLPQPRQPDDAPRWLPTGQITRFQDLTTDTMQTDGSAPMNIYLRLPPDLYCGMKKNLRLYLQYRYNPMPLANDSSINILVNDSYIGSIPLPQGNRPMQELQAYVGLPVLKLHSFLNTLSTVFYFQLHKADSGDPPINQRGAILPSSYIDMRGLHHWAALPNLRLFSTAGFPFTRRADLSATTVILPDSPSSSVIEMYLTMMGRFGGATGYPALRVMVSGPETLGTSPNQDYLVLGTMSDSSVLDRLATSLPVQIQRDGLRVQNADGFFAPLRNAWWRMQGWQPPESGTALTSGAGSEALPDALLEGIESPYQAGHSIVVAVVRDDAEAETFLDALDRATKNGSVAKSVSVLRGREFLSYRLGDTVYHVGHLSVWVQASLWYAQYPYLAVLLILGASFLLSVWILALLRRRAALRVEDHSQDFEQDRKGRAA